MQNNEKTYFHSTKPKDFIERYCSRLNINGELTKLSMFIANIIEKNNIIPENTTLYAPESSILLVEVQT